MQMAVGCSVRAAPHGAPAGSTLPLCRGANLSHQDPVLIHCRYSGHVAAYAYKQIDPTRV